VAADREHRERLQLPRRLDAVDLGHLDVHHDGVGSELFGELDRLAAVARAPDDLEAVVPSEHLLDQGEEGGVVLRDENPVRPDPHVARQGSAPTRVLP